MATQPGSPEASGVFDQIVKLAIGEHDGEPNKTRFTLVTKVGRNRCQDISRIRKKIVFSCPGGDEKLERLHKVHMYVSRYIDRLDIYVQQHCYPLEKNVLSSVSSRLAG